MPSLHNGYDPDAELPAKLAHVMFSAVERKYGRLICEVRKEWERRFAGSDPSDACVTVRINGTNSREFARHFPLEHSRRLGSFVRN
jgi:hypothetical protein